MEKKGIAATAAFLGGLLCFIILVTVGELTGNAVFCWAVVSLVCFVSAMAICWNHPGNLWFTGLLLNLTIWLLMILVGGIEQFRQHLAGMTVPLLLAYAGAVVGWVYPRRVSRT
jgi:hypothetical protein